jgi:diguanylate cyclase (GGDEF)-like protein
MKRKWTALWQGLSASLKWRVLALTLAVFMAVAVPAFLAFHWIVDTTIVKLGTLFAEKQVLFDRYRGMDALMREVSLAETLARAPAVREWAANENDPDKKARGIGELEHFRIAFKDQSYFFVVDGSGHYYFNDRQDSFSGNQLRYTLDRNNPRDGWYVKTTAAGPGCQLNVDRDDKLAVTKVWINCPVMDGKRVLGVLGTGVDLSAFIQEVVNFPQTGVQSMFVDRDGAIQAHRDPAMVDFHSLTNDTKNKKTIFRQLDSDADRETLAGMLATLTGGETAVESRFMRIDGHQYLVGVGYLDRLGWFNVTLMDVDRIIDRRLFLPIAGLLGFMMAAAVVLLTLLFKRSVLDRLARAEEVARRVAVGDFSIAEIDNGPDEIGRLSRTFARMVQAVGHHTRELEATVQERTDALRRLAHFDPLTEIYNRRGFTDAALRVRRRAKQIGKDLGLMLIDMDLFKHINDEFGHASGDVALAQAARRLESTLQANDICARWGGDEFVVLIADSDDVMLALIGTKLLDAVGRPPVRLDDGRELTLTLSIGACRMAADAPLEQAVAQADAALYAAKRAGHNRVVVYDPARHSQLAAPQAKSA